MNQCTDVVVEFSNMIPVNFKHHSRSPGIIIGRCNMDQPSVRIAAANNDPGLREMMFEIHRNHIAELSKQTSVH